MFLYKSYCYENLQQVIDSIHSEFVLPFGVIQSVSAFSANSVSVSYLSENNGSIVQNSFIYPVADCQKLGFNSSFSGLTVEDSSQIGAAVVAVLITAWSIKIIKRLL